MCALLHALHSEFSPSNERRNNEKKKTHTHTFQRDMNTIYMYTKKNVRNHQDSSTLRGALLRVKRILRELKYARHMGTQDVKKEKRARDENCIDEKQPKAI